MQCKGTKADGKQCTRNATVGEYCRSHNPDKDKEDKPAKPARGGAISLEFESIAARAMEELERTKTEGVRVQWMRLIFDCCKGAKEEQRLLDGLGAGAEYKLILTPPAPRVPEQDETPPEGAAEASEGDGKVVH